MKPKYDWCEIQQRYIGEPRGNKGARSAKQPVQAPRVRCPKCGRMLTARTIDIEPFGSDFAAAWVIPRHKKRLPNPRRPKKEKRSGRLSRAAVR